MYLGYLDATNVTETFSQKSGYWKFDFTILSKTTLSM